MFVKNNVKNYNNDNQSVELLIRFGKAYYL